MALSILFTPVTGNTINASDWIAEFNNIYNNSLTLISPLTGDLAFGGFRATGLSLGTVSNPMMSPTGDSNTGPYSPGADIFAISAGGVDVIRFETVASGVNYLDITASATTNPVLIAPAGSDTNIGLQISTKGTGTQTFRTGTTSRLRLDNAYNLTLFQATANYTLAWSDPAAARTLTIPDPLASDTFAFLNATQTLSAKTLATPIFTTSMTGPLVIGGTGVSSTLTLRSTSGVGTTGADIIFQAGNNGGTELMRLLNGGTVLIGDTANSNMTIGLTLNQGAADNHILTCRSSDVAHGLTTGGTVPMSTNDYLAVGKGSANGGGPQLVGITDGDESSGVTWSFYGYNQSGPNTAKTTAARGIFEFNMAQHSGANAVQNVAADGNLAVIRTQAAGSLTTRFIFDTEGSAHADVEWIAFDKYDDVSLVNEIETALLSGLTPEQAARREYLENTGVIGSGSWHFENGRPRAMINFTRLGMLHHGALIQIGHALTAINQHGCGKCAGLESRLNRIEGTINQGGFN